MKLTKEQVSSYLSSAFNNESIRELVKNSESKNSLGFQMIQLSKFLLTYLIATGDLSSENMMKIINDYINFHDEILNEETRYGTLDSTSVYFKNHVFPIVVEKYCKNHGIQGNVSLKDYEAIYKEMVRTSKINNFATHSFPGILYDEVSKNGLNIDRELFREEINFLSQYGFNSPYQSGRLYLTDLSYQTIGYALGTPEKVRISFSNLTDLTEEDFETTYDYHKRVIEMFLSQNSNLPNIETAVTLLNRINDFYFTNDDSCIAVVEKNNDYNPNDIYIPGLFSYTLGSSYQFNKLFQVDEYFKNMYEKTNLLLEENKNEGVEMLDMMMQYVSSKYPDSEETTILKNKIEYDLFYGIRQYGLNCFDNANGEGFIVESGMIACEDMSISKFKNPMSLYPKLKKNHEQLSESNHSSKGK